jgi:transcription-repair coupling factor (superfamily II helicase)
VLAAARLYNQSQKPIMFVADNADEAGYYYFDFTKVVDKELVTFFPAFYKNVNKQGNTDKANEILRTDALNRISNEKPCITITYPEALIEKVVSNKNFDDIKISIKQGQNYDRTELLRTLEKFGFQEVDFVYEAGQFSMRGSIIDIFSYSDENPYRLDFFGSKAESIRSFDIEKQLSIKELSQISIVPDFENDDFEKISLLEFIKDDTILIFNDIHFCKERIGKIYTDALIKANETAKKPDLFSFLINGETFENQADKFRKIVF